MSKNIVSAFDEVKLIHEILRFIPCDAKLKSDLDLALIAGHIKEYFQITFLKESKSCEYCKNDNYKRTYNPNYYS